MHAPSNPRLGTWATFGTMMLIALLAWSMDAPELGMALAIGSVGAGIAAAASRIPIRATLRRITPHARV